MGRRVDMQRWLSTARRLGNAVFRMPLPQQGERVAHKTGEFRTDKGVDVPLETVTASFFREGWNYGKRHTGRVGHGKPYLMTTSAVGAYKLITLPLYLADDMIGNQTVHKHKKLIWQHKGKQYRGTRQYHDIKNLIWRLFFNPRHRAFPLKKQQRL